MIIKDLSRQLKRRIILIAAVTLTVVAIIATTVSVVCYMMLENARGLIF